MEALEARAALYSLLALAFLDPGEDADLGSIAADIQVVAGEEPGVLGESLERLRAATEEIQLQPISAAEEYTYLFNRQALVAPYESTYTLAGMEQNLADIAGFHRAFGVTMSPEVHERVDHIGSELEFMGLLCAKEAQALSRGLIEQARICREARASFLTDHLGTWVLMFVPRMQERARLSLYPSLGEVLAQVVGTEAADLGVVLAPADGSAPVHAGAPSSEDLTCE